MKNFLQVDDAVVVQKGHAAAKLNDLMNLYDNATTTKQYNAVKELVLAFRFGTYFTNTIKEAFELFSVKNNATAINIKSDFLNWLKQAKMKLNKGDQKKSPA